MSSELNQPAFSLSGKELLGIYLLLRSQGEGLDFTLKQLEQRIERTLYASLTVEQFERLAERYRKMI